MVAGIRLEEQIRIDPKLYPRVGPWIGVSRILSLSKNPARGDDQMEIAVKTEHPARSDGVNFRGFIVNRCPGFPVHVWEQPGFGERFGWIV